jgi:hypothetical protein
MNERERERERERRKTCLFLFWFFVFSAFHLSEKTHPQLWLCLFLSNMEMKKERERRGRGEEKERGEKLKTKTKLLHFLFYKSFFYFLHSNVEPSAVVISQVQKLLDRVHARDQEVAEQREQRQVQLPPEADSERLDLDPPRACRSLRLKLPQGLEEELLSSSSPSSCFSFLEGPGELDSVLEPDAASLSGVGLFFCFEVGCKKRRRKEGRKKKGGEFFVLFCLFSLSLLKKKKTLLLNLSPSSDAPRPPRP